MGELAVEQSGYEVSVHFDTSHCTPVGRRNGVTDAESGGTDQHPGTLEKVRRGMAGKHFCSGNRHEGPARQAV